MMIHSTSRTIAPMTIQVMTVDDMKRAPRKTNICGWPGALYMVWRGAREAAAEGSQYARQDRTRGAFRHRGDCERFQGVLSGPRVAGGARARARSARPAASPDGPIWYRDDAAVAQRAGGAGDPRSGAGERACPPRQRFSGGASAQAARPLPGARRAADAGPGARRQGAAALRRRPRLQGRAGQRLRAGRRQGHGGLLLPRGVLAVLGSGRAPRRAVLSAPAQSAAARRQDLRGPQLAAW